MIYYITTLLLFLLISVSRRNLSKIPYVLSRTKLSLMEEITYQKPDIFLAILRSIHSDSHRRL